jgi:hypothetical protein
LLKRSALLDRSRARLAFLVSSRRS